MPLLYNKHPVPPKLPVCLFQLCLFYEATVPEYKPISGTLPQCVLCFACTCTVLQVWYGICYRRCSVTLQSPTATQIPLFPTQSTLGADILVFWIGKIVQTCAASGSRTPDFLREQRIPYPLGHVLHFWISLNKILIINLNSCLLHLMI